jgi:photosystem II stability/assembly factor-like uncharacterized protein
MKKLLLILSIVTSFSMNAQFWTVKATTFATVSRGISGISIVDANTVWAKAYDGVTNGSTTVKEYTKSVDGGNTWTSGSMGLGTGSGGLGISSITAASGTIAWVSAFPATSGLGGIWKTINGGTTWTKQTTALFNDASFSFANFVYFFNDTDGVCMGDPVGGYFEIYTTTTGGTTWTRVPSTNIPTPSPANAEYGYSNSYDVVGNTIWFGTSSGRMFKSTDKGLTWTLSGSPAAITDWGSATQGGSYTFSDASKGLILSSSGVMYNTIDGGTTWNTQAFTGPIFVNEFEYVPGTTRVISAGSGSSYSLDDGLTWTGVDTAQHTETKFFDLNTGFTGGFTTSATVGGISKYTGTELKTDSFISNKFSTYPNPVNNVVTISNTDNIAFSEVAISDMNGRTVKTFKVNDLTEVEFNVSDLSSGVYFMSIATDSGKAVKKFIKN